MNSPINSELIQPFLEKIKKDERFRKQIKAFIEKIENEKKKRLFHPDPRVSNLIFPPSLYHRC